MPEGKPRRAAHNLGLLPSDEHLRMVNELVPTATPLGAYNLGVASAAAMRYGIEPTREFLVTAMAAASVQQAVDFVSHWIAESVRLKYDKEPY